MITHCCNLDVQGYKYFGDWVDDNIEGDGTLTLPPGMAQVSSLCCVSPFPTPHAHPGTGMHTLPMWANKLSVGNEVVQGSDPWWRVGWWSL